MVATDRVSYGFCAARYFHVREKVPKTKSKRGARRKQRLVQLNADAQAAAMGADNSGGETSTSANTFSKAPRFGVGAAPIGLPREHEKGANPTSTEGSDLGQVNVAQRVAEVEAREAAATDDQP